MNSEQSTKMFAPDACAVESLREAFESELHSSGNASIEPWLERVPDRLKPELFSRLLHAEVEFHVKNGVKPERVHYRDRFPHFDQQIQAVFERHSAESSDSVSMASTIDPAARKGNSGSPRRAWTIGDTVGNYRLDEFVARGGFGEVWKGLDLETNRVVAIKLPRGDRPSSPEISLMFRSEAEHAALLKHDGIVPIYEVGECETGFFIVSEFIDGQTLHQRMRTRTISRTEATQIVRTLALILAKAHQNNLIHRDIKPSNIMIRKDGSPTITDFGLAVSEIEQSNLPECVIGTVSYMSPEQARGETRLMDGRSDLYSLGVVLFELLTGRLPFKGANQEELLYQIRHREVRSLRSIDESIPKILDDICLKSLSKDIRHRYATGLDLAADLERWNAANRKWKRNSIIGLTTVLIGLIVVFGITIWRPQESDASKTKNAIALFEPPKTDHGRSMLDKPLEPIVSFTTNRADTFAQSTEKKRLSAKAEDSFWILATEHVSKAPIRMQGTFYVEGWVGSVGFVWGLVHPLETTQQPLHCFACVIERFNEADQLSISIRKFKIGELVPGSLSVTGEEVQIEPIPIAVLPFDSPAKFEVAIEGSRIDVRIDENVVSMPEIPTQTMARLAETNGRIGFILRGSMISIRDAYVECLTSAEKK